MPGLQLLGPIAGKPSAPSPDRNASTYEGFGMFVVGDAFSIRHYSGLYPGWRWLCQARGPLVGQVGVWPTPDGATSSYFVDPAAAHAMYGQIRQHALAMAPDLRIEPVQGVLNEPSCHYEKFFRGNHEVLSLLWDHMTDMQVALTHTDAISVYAAHPADPAQGNYVAYHSQNEVLYVAVATAPSGAVEHLCLIFSDKHMPQPTIPEGMPRAEWVKASGKGALSFPTGVAVAQWGRLSGAEAQWAEQGPNPAASLLQRMGNQPFVALQPPGELAQRLGNVPAAYALRMEPGQYTATYYELSTERFGGFSFLAISREGAPSFLPVVLGNAGGMAHGGLSMEQYAQLSVERDNLLMQKGPTGLVSGEMAAICRKYGQPFDGGLRSAMNGRVDGWEQMIQRDPAFSAQWAMQLGVARLRLQGVEPTQQHLDQIAQQQQQTQHALEQNNRKQENLRNEINNGARRILDGARQWTPQQIVSAVPSFAPSARPQDVLYHAVLILKKPDEYGKHEAVKDIVEKIAHAHWLSMPDDDRRFEGGKEDGYVKEVIKDVFEANGLPVPGVGGFFSRMLDKL